MTILFFAASLALLSSTLIPPDYATEHVYIYTQERETPMEAA